MPGPAVIVGWSRLAVEMVSSDVGNVCPALVLPRTRMLLNDELNEAPYRLPNASNAQVGSPASAGHPSAPVNREVQLSPPLVVNAAELRALRSLAHANIRCGLVGSIAI